MDRDLSRFPGPVIAGFSLAVGEALLAFPLGEGTGFAPASVFAFAYFIKLAIWGCSSITLRLLCKTFEYSTIDIR